MKKVSIYTDGSSLGNPGAGGYAGIIKYKDIEKVYFGGVKLTTNNRMELIAVIEGVKLLKESSDIQLFSDSQYVVKSINIWLKNWIKKDFKNIKNIELWKEYLEYSKVHKISAFWIKAHSGHPENERCDQLAYREAKKYKNNNFKL